MAKKGKIKSDLVLTARDLLKGYIAGSNSPYQLWNITPLQFVEDADKDEDWIKWNLDFLERVALRQLMDTGPRLLKNYNMANGILDLTDFGLNPETNEFAPDVQVLGAQSLEKTQVPLKFYPIIPNIINVLVGEFTKRDNKIIPVATDEFSKNEIYEKKFNDIMQVLANDAKSKIEQQLLLQGIDYRTVQDPQQQQQIQQQMDAAAQLAQIETKYKNYRGIAEEWAAHMLEWDTDRFRMNEMEVHGFRDMLVADREFWHVRVLEDDIKLELWNPRFTFYHKSPDVYWISEGNYVGQQKYMTASDIINIFGDQMDETDIEKLKNFAVTNGFGSNYIPASVADQTHWYNDYNRPYPESQKNVTWEAWWQDRESNSSPAFTMYDMQYRNNFTYMSPVDSPFLLRVTEAYWISQRKVGHLVVKDDAGAVIFEDIVDENHKVTNKPVYDKSLQKKETVDNLIKGEHVEWVWINELRHGVKIGSNRTGYYYTNPSEFQPIYLGGERCKFEFKGKNKLYGTKLPVEGKIFSDRNSISQSLVDRMKGFQINYNIVNNQIVELLADAVGKVMVIDQNMIPKKSMDESWGNQNFTKFFQIMQDYKIAPIDTSLANTQTATNFQHFQVMDMSNTDMIMAKLKLGEYFKNEAFATVGITPQRLGEMVGQPTATGVEQSVTASHAQTEWYFEQHMNHLMPRVRQMMLEAEQFLCAEKPWVSIKYMNSNEENAFFKMEGWRNLLTDLNVVCKSSANVKATMQMLKQALMQNNTAGGSLYELAQVGLSNSPAELISKLKKAEEDRKAQIEQQQKHEQEMQQQQQQFLEKERIATEQRDDYWKQKQMELDLQMAEIKAAGYSTEDLNANQQSDALDFIKEKNKEIMNNDKMSFEQRKHQDKINLERQKIDIQRQKILSDQMIQNKEAEDVRILKGLSLKNQNKKK